MDTEHWYAIDTRFTASLIISYQFSGPIYCPIYWSSLSSCLYGISQSKWHRRSFFCERDGLPRSSKFSGNIWGRAGHVCKKRVAERGMNEF